MHKDSLAWARFLKAHKDDTQPVQFRLFDKTGEEIFKLVNCYVEQPIRMNWNVQGCLDVFPPQIDIETLNQHYYDLDFLLSTIHSLDSRAPVSQADLPEADYYAVVFWNAFFKKPSRKLIQSIRSYVAEQESNIQLLYINNHNAEIWAIADAETKEQLKGLLAERENRAD